MAQLLKYPSQSIDNLQLNYGDNLLANSNVASGQIIYILDLSGNILTTGMFNTAISSGTNMSDEIFLSYVDLSKIPADGEYLKIATYEILEQCDNGTGNGSSNLCNSSCQFNTPVCNNLIIDPTSINPGGTITVNAS